MTIWTVWRFAKNAGKALQHAVRPADDLGRAAGQRGIGLVEPRGQADAAGDAVQFRDAEAVFGQDDVRADDARHVRF